MAQTLSQSRATWTAYPSLLPSLLQEEQQAALEEAAFAQYCGRYGDAHSIFNSRLPESSTMPILALQRADMLTTQGYEHERIDLLQAALNVLSKAETALRPIRLLMEMMLADAQFWALGEMRPALSLLPAVRNLLRTSGMEKLSDIELRCVTLYYGIVGSFEVFCNFVGKSDKTIFPGFHGDKGSEVKCLRKILQSHEKWRFAPTFMQLELAHTKPGLTLKDVVTDAMNLCGVMDNLVEAPLLFRSVILKKQLVAILSGILPSMAANLQQQYIGTIGKIKSLSYIKWEDFCPVIAFDIAKARILDSTSSYAEKIDQLLEFIQDAERRHDYTKANQAYISTRDVAQEWFRKVKGTGSAPVALKSLRAVQESYLKFHQERTMIAFFEASACSDYQTTLLIYYHEYSTMLSQGEDFQKRHPRFGVPRQQERLYDHAIMAAGHLGMIDKQKVFAEKYDEWLQHCNFVKGVALINDGISETELVNREIITSGDDFVQWGVNAVRVMLRWAGSEWEQDLMSTGDCEFLFGPGLNNLPEEDLARYIAEVDVVTLSGSIFGSHDEPKNTLLFQDQYHRLRDWILIPSRLPSRSARITVLKIFMQSRLYRVRQSLIMKGEVSELDQVVAMEEESQALAEIELLEEEENGEAIKKQERSAWARIHATLVKSFSTEAVQSGLIKDTELQARVIDCKELLEQQRNNGNLVGQYRAIVQLLTLMWQRFLHFKSIAPEDLMPHLKKAEDLFTEIRKYISGLDPSEDLAAKAQLSQDFSHREHYNYALAATLSAFDLFTAQARSAQTENFLALASQKYQDFLRWALRSKGRGFMDILNLDTSVARTIDRSNPQLEPDPSTESSSSNNNDKSQTIIPELGHALAAIQFSSSDASNPFQEATATSEEIDELLQSLPESVLLVDFIDVRYGQGPASFVAVVYRHGQKNLPTRIPNINIAKIDRWVRENLETGKRGEARRLDSADALKRLETLSGLLEPLFRSGSQAAIRRGETVILCPTGSLNRVPIHAIPIDGKPFIERNPIVYCQSLTMLRWLWSKHQDRSVIVPPPKISVINPMPDLWKKDRKPVASTVPVANLARSLRADFQHGFDLKKSTVLKAVEGSSILHYHGHVTFNPRSALDSVMILNQKAYEAVNVKRAGCEAVAARELFKIQLGDLALATIIGCGSGITSISSTDDVLGLPTALFYAGAGAVVSTLWSTDDEDGAAFATEFYGAIAEQRKAVADTVLVASADDGVSIFDRTVDLARAMQVAVLKLRTDPTRKDKQAPYHWAGFTLNGLWMLPDCNFPGVARRWTEAEKIEVQVMETKRRVLGEEHPDTLTSMDNLALTHHSQGKLSEAEKSSNLQPLTLYGTETHKFVLELKYWNHLTDFIKSEFDPPWQLDDIIVLVGDDENTWCTTCKTYIDWRWGSFGSVILTFVSSLLTIPQNHTCNPDAEAVPKTDVSDCCTFIRTERSQVAVTLQLLSRADVPSMLVEGPRQAVQEVADILGWIFDSLRLQQISDKIGHGDNSVVVKSETKMIYSVAMMGAGGRLSSKSNCWHPLFPGKVVSGGRIPERPANMKGLEIAYPLLIAISGVDLPAVEEDGIYLDGYRSALYPILRDLPSQSLQWHLKTVESSQINDDEGEDVGCDRPRSKTAPLVWYKTLALSDITTAKRHFVGWCSSAIITLGTSMQDPANLEWSEAKCHKRSVIETTTNLNLNLSFHGVGATVGRTFKRGRNERNPYENHEENLRSALINARKSQVLLLRPSTQQGWLVPKSSVLLQLVQSYMACLMAEESSLSLPIHFATASHDGGQNAYQALWDRRNEAVPLDDSQNPCYFFNIVRMFLFALEKLTKLSEAGDVCGWEMRDIVDPPEFFEMKRQGFRWRQLPWWGGWNQLLPEIRLVLYFEGLNDPIVAEKRHGCANCTTIPRGRNLLGITMVSLKHFTRRFRSKYLNGNGQLTESCYWDSPTPLFGRGCHGEKHRCSAIQRIIKTDRCNPPGPDELSLGEEGAVIFEPCTLSYAESRLRI